MSHPRIVLPNIDALSFKGTADIYSLTPRDVEEAAHLARRTAALVGRGPDAIGHPAGPAVKRKRSKTTPTRADRRPARSRRA